MPFSKEWKDLAFALVKSTQEKAATNPLFRIEVDARSMNVMALTTTTRDQEFALYDRHMWKHFVSFNADYRSVPRPCGFFWERIGFDNLWWIRFCCPQQKMRSVMTIDEEMRRLMGAFYWSVWLPLLLVRTYVLTFLMKPLSSHIVRTYSTYATQRSFACKPISKCEPKILLTRPMCPWHRLDSY